MRYVSVVIVMLVCVSVFPISQRAIEYYSAAELSYKSGDYVTALRNYELSLTTDPTIEGYDSYIKFKMGISAYMIGNYDKARSYLSGYNTGFVKELLSSIDKRQAQDEWKRWILKNKPVVSEVSTQTTSNTTLKTKPINFILLITVFMLVFVALLFAEIRIIRIRKQVIELPLIPEKEKITDIGSQPLQTTEVTEKEIHVEDEIIGLIPENAKIVDFEKLINSEIDIFKDLLEGVTNVEEVSIKEEDYEKSPEVQEKEKQEEVIEDRRALIEDILQESKELIDNLGMEKHEESHSTLQVELSQIESKFIDTLKEYSSKLPSGEELGIEELEKIRKDFTYFDDLEKITDEDSKLLVKKLITIHRGENS